MARRKRQSSTFNLSFLDIMSCGFGAVVLVFLIIDHSLEVEIRTVNAEVLSEVELLEEDIREGEAGLVRLRAAACPCSTGALGSAGAGHVAAARGGSKGESAHAGDAPRAGTTNDSQIKSETSAWTGRIAHSTLPVFVVCHYTTCVYVRYAYGFILLS